MKRLFLSVLLLLSAAALGAQTTTITATKIVGGDGATPLGTGKVIMQPTDLSGNPLIVNSGSTHGLMLPKPAICFISNGAITTNMNWGICTTADTSQTNASYVCYKTTFVDTVSGWTSPTLPCVQPTGSTWSFDTYVPPAGPTAMVISGATGSQGPQGIQGAQGPASWNARGPYSAGVTYNNGDVVGYGANDYVCTSGCSSITPGTSTGIAGPNGTVVGAVTFSPFKFGEGASGFSSTKYIDAGTTAMAIGGSANWTLELQTAGGTGAFGVMLGDSVNNNFYLTTSGGFFGVEINGSIKLTSMAINNGSQHHLAVTMSGGTMKMWVDGVLGNTSSIAGWAGVTTDMTLGAWGYSHASSSAYGIAEVALFNYAKYATSFTPPTVAYSGSEYGLQALYHLATDASNSAGLAWPWTPIGLLTAVSTNTPNVPVMRDSAGIFATQQITFGADPTTAMQAVTKEYSDAAIATLAATIPTPTLPTLTAGFSNGGSALVPYTACGVATTTGPMSSVALTTDSSVGNAKVDMFTESLANWIANGSGALGVGGNGTVVGSPTFGSVKFGEGTTSVTTANYIDLGNSVMNFGATDSWAVEAQLTTTGTSGAVVLGDHVATMWLGVLSGYPAMNYSGTTKLAATLVNDGALHHVAWVVTGGSSLAFYVDGVLSSTAAITIPSMNIDWRIGGSTGWSGGLAEIAVWNGAHYTHVFTPPTSAYAGNEAGLRALYHLAGNGNNAVTLQSMSNGQGLSFSSARGITVSTFTGWGSTTITSGQVYCFGLTNPGVITGLTTKVVY